MSDKMANIALLIAGGAVGMAVLINLSGNYAGERGAPGAAAAVPTGAVVVEMVHLRFRPEVLEVEAGATVAFVNRDVVMDHTVNEGDPKQPEGSRFFSPLVEPGNVWVRTFDEPGTYPLYCRTHGHNYLGMNGTLVVKPRS